MYTLQFYKNNYFYPDFSNNLTKVGASLNITPININQKGGVIRVSTNWDDIMSANYLKLTLDSQTVYGWINDYTHISGDNLFEVLYDIDSFRTFKSKINFGTQFIKRSPTATNRFDELLSGNDSLEDISIEKLSFPNASKRTLVVQISNALGTVFNEPFKTPLQPSPYINYYCDYDVNNWPQTTAINNLIKKLTSSNKPINVVNMYSIPNLNNSSENKFPMPMPLEFEVGEFENLEGFYLITPDVSLTYKKISLANKVSRDITQTAHTAQIIIPEAGIINIPTEYLLKSNVYLRQDIDVYSGSCNYAIGYTEGGVDYLTRASTRGGGLSSIPLAYDPTQQMLALNQTYNKTAMVNDVASVVSGGVQIGAGIVGFAATGGLSLAAVGTGAAKIGSTIYDAATREDKQKDSLQTHSSPPAYLGSALGVNFNDSVFLVINKKKKDNASIVHSRFGYPYNQLKALTLPSQGFIQTEECNVTGTAPAWAIMEINKLLDNGLRIR